MKIVKKVPPKKTEEKKYMFVCRSCEREENGFNRGKTIFVADYPKDFEKFLSPSEYCECPVCGRLHYRSRLARLRYLWSEFVNGENGREA